MKVAALFALSLSVMASLAWATDASMKSSRDAASPSVEHGIFLASDGADAIERFHRRIKELQAPKKEVDSSHSQRQA